MLALLAPFFFSFYLWIDFLSSIHIKVLELKVWNCFVHAAYAITRGDVQNDKHKALSKCPPFLVGAMDMLSSFFQYSFRSFSSQFLLFLSSPSFLPPPLPIAIHQSTRSVVFFWWSDGGRHAFHNSLPPTQGCPLVNDPIRSGPAIANSLLYHSIPKMYC